VIRDSKITIHALCVPLAALLKNYSSNYALKIEAIAGCNILAKCPEVNLLQITFFEFLITGRDSQLFPSLPSGPKKCRFIEQFYDHTWNRKETLPVKANIVMSN
jgi:hypothetical protein